MASDISLLLRDISALISEELPNLQERRYNISWKDDGSPVTDADIYLENAIETVLRSRIGEIEFIGEETWKEGIAANVEWRAVLDPIDGTENFCSGLKEWGTSLSIWRHQEHAGSLLMMPGAHSIRASFANSGLFVLVSPGNRRGPCYQS